MAVVTGAARRVDPLLYFIEALSAPGIREQAAMYHQAIFDAIVARDEQVARTAMRSHLVFVADAWLASEQTDHQNASPSDA